LYFIIISQSLVLLAPSDLLKKNQRSKIHPIGNNFLTGIQRKDKKKLTLS